MKHFSINEMTEPAWAVRFLPSFLVLSFHFRTNASRYTFFVSVIFSTSSVSRNLAARSKCLYREFVKGRFFRKKSLLATVRISAGSGPGRAFRFSAALRGTASSRGGAWATDGAASKRATQTRSAVLAEGS